MNNNFSKYIYKVIIVIIITTLIELIVFNFDYFAMKINSESMKSITLTTEDFQPLNWTKQGEFLVSGLDSALVIEHLDMKIKNIKIIVDTEQNIPYTDVFYTDKEHPNIVEDTHIRSVDSYIDNYIVVNINKCVDSLRIDLGDSEGLSIKGITVVVNQCDLDFSFARLLAMNLIYWFAILLFALQRPPKYNI